MPKTARARALTIATLAAGTCLSASVHAGVGTVLFVVNNPASLDSQEAAKRALMEGWGYTVTPISATANQAAYDTGVRASSVAYISETVNSSDVGTKLTAAPIGVITEEAVMCDKLGFASGMTTFSGTAINITNASHYITSTLGAGNKTIFSFSQPVRYLSGTLGGYTMLARTGASSPVLAVLERSDTLTPGGTAAGRRVYLPFGNTGYDVNALTADGRAIMQRSIEWCLLPVCHWKLNETSGTTAVDSEGGRNGALANGPVWASGKIANGLRFDGTNDYVSIADHESFRVTHALTVAAWVRANGSWSTGSSTDPILRKGDDNPNNWNFCIADGGRVELNLDCGDNDANSANGNTVLQLNRWYHVAATWDGAKIRLYVNGNLDNTPKNKAAPIGTDTRPIYIGGRTDPTDTLNGVLDDVRFYSRALTAEEVRALGSLTPTINTWQTTAP